ncbi:MAG: bifunctional nuclease family protein [Chloroflexota bacterium]
MATDGTTGAVEMRVADVWQSPQGAMPMHLILLEEVGGKRLLPIKVGPGEGAAIAQQLYRRAAARPMTYALMAALVRETGAQVRNVTITRLAEGTFYATITLEASGETRAVDARPSDAIGLALAAELPIRADAAVLAIAGIEADPPDVLQRAPYAGVDLLVEHGMLTMVPATAPAAGTPAAALPVNLDFTAELHGWKLAGSVPQEYALTATADEWQPKSGAASLAARNPNPDGFGTILQWCRADAYRDTRVRLSAEVKAEGVVGWAGLWMRIDGPRQTLRYADVTWTRVSGATATLGFDNMEQRPIKGTRNWQRYNVVLDVPPASAEIYYGLLLAGGGQIWLADVRFEVVGPEAPVTGVEGV